MMCERMDERISRPQPKNRISNSKILSLEVRWCLQGVPANSRKKYKRRPNYPVICLLQEALKVVVVIETSTLVQEEKVVLWQTCLSCQIDFFIVCAASVRALVAEHMLNKQKRVYKRLC